MPRQVSNGPYSITTAPSLTVCPQCRRPMLAATIGGLDRHVDPTSLNDAGELAALLEGRRTFAVVATDYLSRRTTFNIKSGPPRHPVLAEHACKVTPAHHIDQAWNAAVQVLLYSALGVTVPATGSNDDPPPF